MNQYWKIGENYFSKSYTLEEAKQLANTLINCRGCIDCSFCRNCVDCERCTFCDYCVDCKSARYCYECEHCFNIEACVVCVDCRNIGYARKSQGVSSGSFICKVTNSKSIHYACCVDSVFNYFGAENQ